MADWFAHRLDAEEIAAKRIERTGKLSMIRPSRGGFIVIDTQRSAGKRPISEIKLATESKVLVGTIDCTPSWSAVLPVYLETLTEGKTPERRWQARQELEKMARLADLWVASQKRERAA